MSFLLLQWSPRCSQGANMVPQGEGMPNGMLWVVEVTYKGPAAEGATCMIRRPPPMSPALCRPPPPEQHNQQTEKDRPRNTPPINRKLEPKRCTRGKRKSRTRYSFCRNRSKQMFLFTASFQAFCQHVHVPTQSLKIKPKRLQY